MLFSVLNSDRASRGEYRDHAHVRRAQATPRDSPSACGTLEAMEKKYDHRFKVVFDILEATHGIPGRTPEEADRLHPAGTPEEIRIPGLVSA